MLFQFVRRYHLTTESPRYPAYKMPIFQSAQYRKACFTVTCSYSLLSLSMATRLVAMCRCLGVSQVLRSGTELNISLCTQAKLERCLVSKPTVAQKHPTDNPRHDCDHAFDDVNPTPALTVDTGADRNARESIGKLDRF